MASAIPALPKEQTNFLKVANLLITLSPKAVRILFNREFYPGALKSVLSKNWMKLDNLKKAHVITQAQWSLLFPSGSDPKSNDFDLSLMVCLLRNLTKIAIQDQLPLPSDMSEDAALTRIKYYRNQIAHSDSGAMSDSDFNATFAAVSKAIEIICPTMKSDCSNLQNADLDCSFHEIYVEVFKKEKQMEELTAKIETLNLEGNNIQYIQTEEISEWKKKLQTFYVTEAATKLIEFVKNNQCIIITGIPGSGKSSLAYYVALLLENVEDYIVLPLWLPSDLLKMSNSKAKQIFIFDDVFGKYSLDEFNLNCWESDTRRIKKLLKNKVHKVVVTCRTNLYDMVRDCLSSLSFVHFNLQSDGINLSLVERKEISKLYLSDNVVCHLNDEIIMMYNFFPLLCVMFKENKMDDVDFFQDPNQFIQNEIENYKSKRDLSFIALALLVLSNNSIEKDGLQIGNSKYTNMLQDLFDECDPKKSPTQNAILSHLQNLKNMYLTETDSVFCTKHDKVFDIISRAVAPFIIQCILRHGDTAFISSRCLLKSFDEQHGDCTIVITDEFQTRYFERIMKDIESGHNWEVFASLHMNFEKYRRLLMQHLDEMSPKFSSSKNDFISPLHVTAAKGYYDISEYLLKKTKKLMSSLDDFNRSPLHQAAMNGHREITHLLLKNGARIDQKDNEGYTPLLQSCGYGYTEVAEELITNYSSVNICGKDGWYPLHMAASDGNSDLIKILIKHQADIDKQMHNGMTPLYIATSYGNLLTVKLLLESYADVNKCENKKWSPLNVACLDGSKDIIEVLILNDADVNQYNDDGETPLHSACRRNQDCKRKVGQSIIKEAVVNEEDRTADVQIFQEEDTYTHIIKHLIKHGADVNSVTHNGKTPIYFACECAHLEAVKLLLLHEADANKCDKNEMSPLDIASGQRNEDIVDVLLKQGVPFNHCFADGSTCFYGNKNIEEISIKEGAAVHKDNETNDWSLLIACKFNDNEKALKLLHNGANVNHHGEKGRTPLYFATCNDNTKLISILMEHEADVNFQMNNGMTPIFIACKDNHLEAVKTLLIFKADINKCDESGWSPLHVASYYNHKEVVAYLCEHSNAEVNFCNRYGATPLYLACQEGNEDIVQLLLKHGASIHYLDENKPNPIHIACKVGNISIVELLIKENAEVNLPDMSDITPLYIACQCRCTDAVELLLKNGAEVNKAGQLETEEGWTPLHVSVSSRHTRITELLLDNNAIVNIEDRNGHTPLFYATQQNLNDIIELLEGQGAIFSNNDVQILSLSKGLKGRKCCAIQ